MKKYMKPVMEGQLFVSNEFVSACGDSGAVYKFNCNAKDGTLYYFGSGKNNCYRVVAGESFSKTTASNYNSSRLGNFSDCSVKHTTDTTADFVWGFIDYGGYRGRYDAGEEVIVYIEDFKTNGSFDNAHATSELDITQWETAKS